MLRICSLLRIKLRSIRLYQAVEGRLQFAVFFIVEKGISLSSAEACYGHCHSAPDVTKWRLVYSTRSLQRTCFVRQQNGEKTFGMGHLHLLRNTRGKKECF